MVSQRLREKQINFEGGYHEDGHYEITVNSSDFVQTRYILQELTNPHKKSKLLQLKTIYR